MITNVT